MLSPLASRRSESRSLSEKDYPQLKHQFIMLYGYEMWKEIPLDEFFGMLPEMNKEINKRENFRLVVLKFCGVKNPK